MITSINSTAEHDAALKRIDELIALYPFENVADEEELDRISDLVITYENIHYPIA